MNVMVAFVLCILLTVSCAAAGTSVGNQQQYAGGSVQSGLMDRLLQVPEFKFFVHKDGIGYGSCPVYTAPSIDSFRCANGKAQVSTNSHIDEAGYVSGWLLIRYETNNGGYRVGYIPPNYVQGFKPNGHAPEFDYVPATVYETIYLTDNPLLTGSCFAVLEPGETFHVLGKYTYIGDWWYIECIVDNQVARGFIDRNTSSFIVGDEIVNPVTITMEPTVSPLGTTKIGTVTVNYGSSGDRKFVRKNPDANSTQMAAVNPGEKFPCYAERPGTSSGYWYYIWVEEESVWGWISNKVSTLSY